MGVDSNNETFVMNEMCISTPASSNHPQLFTIGTGSGWRKVDGILKQISCNPYGDEIWGVNANDDVFYKPKLEHQGWFAVPGKLKQVDVGEIGEF